ncbi:MAG TPA: ABC transporter permease [Bacteroidia bacterium]|jgi:peptide/nickel transport system permease protein|nr:ABC transporter permease [Bacteroidia bacterium]
MLNYILKRFLIFIPTFIVITLLGFMISVNAPGDPVERMVSAAESGDAVNTQTRNQREQIQFWTHKLGLDLPVFYVSLSSLSQSDTLYKIYDKDEREALDRLVGKYGNWEEIQRYYQEINAFDNLQLIRPADSTIIHGPDRNKILDVVNAIKSETVLLKASYDDVVIRHAFEKINHLLQAYPLFSAAQMKFKIIGERYEHLFATATPWKNYVPKLNFYANNQYHRWLFGDGEFSKGLIKGDFGISYTSKEPVSNIILSKLGWTVFFSLLSVILAYFVSIPLGVRAAVNRGSHSEKISSLILFLLYSMPAFWLATLLLITFANPDVLHWFPASGVKPVTGYEEGAGFWNKVKASLPYIVLPAICYTYSSFAFLSRTIRVSMLEVLTQDYIRTAKAKGLSDKQIIWKHAFRNALFPIITMFGTVLPSVIGGSVILETIFTIPGMGSEAIEAIHNNDYPMIIAILTITSILTLIGFLIADILYAIVDPRISYK